MAVGIKYWWLQSDVRGYHCADVNYTGSNTALANSGSFSNQYLKIPVQCFLSVRKKENTVVVELKIK